MAKRHVQRMRGATARSHGTGVRRKVARSKRRRTWAIRPATRPHSTPKGKKGYDRRRDRHVAHDKEADG